MKKYYVYVDESYKENIFALSVIWVKNPAEADRIKADAVRKINKKYHFHFKNDKYNIRRIFLLAILNSKINFGIILFNKIPRCCKDYARYYIAEVINNSPFDENSQLIITIKGIEDWINRKKCNIYDESINFVQKRIFYRIKYNDRSGLEIADYIASVYVYCIFNNFDLCKSIKEKIRFKVNENI
ncbi:DUF3800 domain-containing protein [Acidianus brierleyi]|uniref:DUF3800 domain-containing protein n=1 Tax=Acidianus brierleyi TaxID=41673 RepID=A0A2U9IBB8_9CREN|nr:DUF3800 domain-containing protein [Acidianus brierleyi]AWR93300.1 hypothetical protein DFR85_00435 [Acidianus brierleyi]